MVILILCQDKTILVEFLLYFLFIYKPIYFQYSNSL